MFYRQEGTKLLKILVNVKQRSIAMMMDTGVRLALLPLTLKQLKATAVNVTLFGKVIFSIRYSVNSVSVTSAHHDRKLLLFCTVPDWHAWHTRQHAAVWGKADLSKAQIKCVRRLLCMIVAMAAISQAKVVARAITCIVGRKLHNFCQWLRFSCYWARRVP